LEINGFQNRQTREKSIKQRAGSLKEMHNFDKHIAEIKRENT
jgi:hypothetical protein